MTTRYVDVRFTEKEACALLQVIQDVTASPLGMMDIFKSNRRGENACYRAEAKLTQAIQLFS